MANRCTDGLRLPSAGCGRRAGNVMVRALRSVNAGAAPVRFVPNQQWLLETVSGQRRGTVAALSRFGLALLEPGYRLAVGLRNFAFNRGWKKVHRAAVPVISLGNLTTGGTGKTPLVAWVARLLREQEVRCAILSRGYKAPAGGDNDESRELGLLLPDVPVLENPDRVAAAAAAVEELEMEALLLDDGFQHRRLARDLDFVTIDATRPFGYGHLLPRGLLREPRGSLRRADAAIITRAGQVSTDALDQLVLTIARYLPRERIAVCETVPVQWLKSDGRTVPLEKLAGQPLLAFCGIGNPPAFFQLLKQAGFRLAGELVWPDHHAFGPADLDSISSAAERCGGTGLACTVKDLVKLNRNRIGDRPLHALAAGLRFREGEAMLRDLIAAAAGKGDTDRSPAEG